MSLTAGLYQVGPAALNSGLVRGAVHEPAGAVSWPGADTFAARERCGRGEFDSLDVDPRADGSSWLQEPRVLLLRDVVRLRIQVDTLLVKNDRQGEDIYARQYNDLSGWALTEVPDHPCLTSLIRMPDAVTQARPDMGLARLRAHVGRLESCLVNILGVDPMDLPELRKDTLTDELQRKKAQRFEFLHRLWKETDGSRFAIVNMYEVGERIKLNRDEVESVVDYLEGEGLIEFKTQGGGIGITHFGVREVEQALDAPEQGTQHFAPLATTINLLHIDRVEHGAQVQQGTQSSSQSLNQASADLGSILQFANTPKRSVDQLPVSEDDKTVLNSEASALEAQAQSPRPRFGAIRETLQVIAGVLGLYKEAQSSGLLDQAHSLINSLPKPS